MTPNACVSTKLPTAWAGLLVGYNDDSPSIRIYSRETGHTTSFLSNAKFIEEALASLSDFLCRRFLDKGDVAEAPGASRLPVMDACRREGCSCRKQEERTK